MADKVEKAVGKKKPKPRAKPQIKSRLMGEGFRVMKRLFLGIPKKK